MVLEIERGGHKEGREDVLLKSKAAGPGASQAFLSVGHDVLFSFEIWPLMPFVFVWSSF